jgi:hypothetical protein
MEHKIDIEGKARLFTYKVAFDGGSAPNPYGEVCTLAICKPRIRSVAKPKDIVVGFGCGNESKRIVYVMLVNESLSWKEYIERCRTDEMLKSKIPNSDKSPGDCIYLNTNGQHTPLSSFSRHDGYDYERDIISGKKVILSKQFWYFGSGDKYKIFLCEDLKGIVPYGQGHRSDSNESYKNAFSDWFNKELADRGINKPGRLGNPALGPSQEDETRACSCRKNEVASDEQGEE